MKPTHHHHHHLRPFRLSLPSTRLYPSSFTPSSSSSSSFPYPYPSPSPITTPSKLRRHPPPSSYSSIFLLLSLRSLYCLLPLLQSFSLFPFSFIVSFLSFSLYSLFISPPPPLLSLDPLLLRPLLLKSLFLSLSLLLRFHSLSLNGTAPTILADLSGSLLASSLSLSKSKSTSLSRKILGFSSLFLSLFTLSLSWDRAACSPLSYSSPLHAAGECSRLFPIILPFLAGFLGYFENTSNNWGGSPLRLIGRKRVRSLSLAFSTFILFFPALFSFLIDGKGSHLGYSVPAVSIWNIGWPLVNAVLFGVLLNENFTDEKVVFGGRDFRREFVVTFFSTLALEMFYYPKLSLPGFLFCGFLMWVSVRELSSSSLDYLELGSSDPYESLYSMVMNPVRHIWSDSKSRKIALFLLINTGYMVVEFVAGFMSNSLGLISDACHMLFDCAALGIGLYASFISRLPADHRFNYGRGRTEVLSGYVNAVLLVLVGALIVLESVERIFDPQEISTNSLLIVSVGGLLVNMVGLVFFHEEHHHAHGGGGKCSHSHSHSDSNSHHHHHHHLNGDPSNAHNTFDHDHGSNVEHHHSVKVSHELCTGHSHGDHDHHHPCGNQNDHYNDTNKEHINSSKNGREIDNDDHHNDHHIHGHDDDHQCHQDHEHTSESHNHHISGKCTDELHFSLKSCDGHSHVDSTHIHSHGNNEIDQHKGTSNTTYTADHSHSCSSHSNKSSMHKDKDSRKHHHIDHNMEGIFLHVLADTMGSVGVVISTLLIKYKGWVVADPACSIFISAMIVASVIPLLRNSAEILLQRIPRSNEQDLQVAMDGLMRVKGVFSVQNFHSWNYTNSDIVATLHLHLSGETDKASIKNRASGILNEAGIKDITIQVECAKR